MRQIGLALALLASVSMTVLPVAPGYAATPAPSKSAASPQSTKQALAKHAARGEAAIISQAQLDRLAVTHPRLHAKIVAANQAGTVPELTAAEKKLLRTMTAQNMDAFKAGWDPATVWVIVAIVAAVLILFTPIFCPIPLFAWAPGCARYAPAAPPVGIRG